MQTTKLQIVCYAFYAVWCLKNSSNEYVQFVENPHDKEFIRQDLSDEDFNQFPIISQLGQLGLKRLSLYNGN